MLSLPFCKWYSSLAMLLISFTRVQILAKSGICMQTTCLQSSASVAFGIGDCMSMSKLNSWEQTKCNRSSQLRTRSWRRARSLSKYWNHYQPGTGRVRMRTFAVKLNGSYWSEVALMFGNPHPSLNILPHTCAQDYPQNLQGIWISVSCLASGFALQNVSHWGFMGYSERCHSCRIQSLHHLSLIISPSNPCKFTIDAQCNPEQCKQFSQAAEIYLLFHGSATATHVCTEAMNALPVIYGGSSRHAESDK